MTTACIRHISLVCALVVLYVPVALATLSYKGVTYPTTTSEAVTLGYVTLSARGDYFQDSPFGGSIYGRDASGKTQGAAYWSDGNLPQSAGKYFFACGSTTAPRTPYGGVKTGYDGAVDSATSVLFGGGLVVMAGSNPLRWKTISPYVMNFPNLVAISGSSIVPDQEFNSASDEGRHWQLGGRLTVVTSKNYPLQIKASIGSSQTVPLGFDIQSAIEGPDTSVIVCHSTRSKAASTRHSFLFTGDASEYLGSLVVSNGVNVLFGAKGLPLAKAVTVSNEVQVRTCAEAGATVAISNLTLDASCEVLLNLTNRLLLAGTPNLNGATVKFSRVHALSNAVNRAAILSVPLSIDFEKEDIAIVESFADVPASAYPYWHSVSIESEDDVVAGIRTFYCSLLPIVTLLATDGADDVQYGRSALTNAACWSDGRVPHGGAEYLVRMACTLRTPEEHSKDAAEMTVPQFPGVALAVDSGVFSLRQGHFTVSNLLMKAGTKLAFMNACQAQLHGRMEVAGSSADDFVTVDSYYRSIYDYHVMDAEIFGKGNIVWKGRSTSGVPEGAVKITSVNTNWTGTSTVTIDDAGIKSDGKPVPSDQHCMSLYLTDGRNLGGTLPSFNYKSLTLEQMSQLVFDDNDVTLAEPTRGILIRGKGGCFNVRSGLSAVIVPSVTYDGIARKTGGGLLALRGEALFADGKETTLPVSGSNMLAVTEGDLKILGKDACNGLALSFAAGTRLVLDLEPGDADLRKYGLRNTKGSFGSVTVASGYKLPVVLDLGNRECPSALETRVGLCTFMTRSDAQAFMDRIAVAKPCRGYGVKVSLTDNSDGTTTVVADVCERGLVLIVR